MSEKNEVGRLLETAEGELVFLCVFGALALGGVRMNAEALVLHVLSDVNNACAADIVAILKARSGGKLVISNGAMYPALKRMRGLELIEGISTGVPMGVLGAPRIVYALTSLWSSASREERRNRPGYIWRG